MPPAAALIAAILVTGLVTGCGDEGGDDPSGSGATVAEVEAAMDALVEGPGSAAAFCEILSSRQLEESFGRSEPLRRCRERAEQQGEAAPLGSYDVVEVEDTCARVNVVDQRETETVFFLRRIDGRWLVDNIEIPPIGEEVDVCGRVRLFEPDEATDG